VIHSHFATLIVFAALVSLVFAMLMREEPRARLRFGLTSFAAFVASAIVAGWLMSPFPT
jgi:heme/copper-type cytochrome/quinol oxidase subunit 4